jgi:hypothetical protein
MNDTVEQINEYMMSKIQGEVVTYLSSDSVCSTSTDGLDNIVSYGVPQHVEIPGNSRP